MPKHYSAIDTQAHSEVEMPSERSLGILFALVFLGVALLPWLNGEPPRIIPMVAGLSFLVVSLVRPSLLKPLNVLWFKIGMLLGLVVSPIVMAIVFFVVVTPTGLMLRLMGKDALRLRRDRSIDSYWIIRNHETHPIESMKNQY